jgi:osmotically-inducible protein OsmY
MSSIVSDMNKTTFAASGLVLFVLVARLAGAQSVSAIDTDLADRVRRSVEADRNLSTYAAKINIVASHRNVRLSGLVQNEGEKAQIGSKAAAIAGQRHVVNDLQVMPAATADNTLRDLIRRAGEPRATAVAAAN